MMQGHARAVAQLWRAQVYGEEVNKIGVSLLPVSYLNAWALEVIIPELEGVAVEDCSCHIRLPTFHFKFTSW